MISALPSQEHLLSILRYDPHAGLLYWLPRLDCPQWSATYAGKVAGSSKKKTVQLILTGLGMFRAHRIIWKMVHGTDPIEEIDHIDCDPHNNKLSNLRECTRSQNVQNRRCFNSSGLKGVSFHRQSGLWTSRIYVDGQRRSLGYFKTPEAAHEAYADAALDAFGEFARAA